METARLSKGFTLFEVLVAIVLMTLMSVFFLHATVFSHRVKLDNLIRDEAVKLAMDRLETLRSMPADEVDDVQNECGACSVSNQNCVVRVPVRNTTVSFGWAVIEIDEDEDFKTVQVEICTDRKDFRGQSISYKTSTVLKK